MAIFNSFLYVYQRVNHPTFSMVYGDLTVLPKPGIMVKVREIIPKFMAELFRLVTYYFIYPDTMYIDFVKQMWREGLQSDLEFSVPSFIAF